MGILRPRRKTMHSLLALGAFALVAADITDVATLVESDEVTDYPLTTPWAIAYGDGTVYFSNFGGSMSAIDWVGEVDADGGTASLFAERSDVEGAQVMHVKHIAVDADSGDVYFTSYGGPTDSHIVKCTAAKSCESIKSISWSADSQKLPTGIAYSTSLKRVFYAIVDGELKESSIVSIKPDGSDQQDFVVQGSSVGVEDPISIAIDDENEFVFWVNGAGPNLLQRANLGIEAEDVGTIMPRDGSDHLPQSVAVDAAGKHVYFTDQTSSEHSIGRCDYDGNNVDTVRSLGTRVPHGIAVHPTEKKIYWSEIEQSAVLMGELDDLHVAPQVPSTTTGDASALFVAASSILVALLTHIF